MGQELHVGNQTIKSSGKHQSIKNNVSKLAAGQYTYQIIANGKSYNKSFVFKIR